MIGRKADLRYKIDDVIVRLQLIQRKIAGSRQPVSKFELDELQELGTRYSVLNDELTSFIKSVTLKKKR
ncbi:MAG: hypothetical protein V3W04_00495 [Gammaproteobacteria bacterium]